MPILVRPAAAADIDEAFLWYERQQAGLGDKFLAAVQSALENVVAHPTSYRVVHRETRRVLVHRFPYGIYYRVYGELVVVVACMHGRRDPRR
jgi:plasmid stabilization system protein ParE